MSEQNAPEPTMEEILASIRRIISEDEPAPGEAAVAELDPEPEPEPAPAPAAVHEDPEDVLELTDPVPEAAAAVETHGDLDVLPAAPPPKPVFAAPRAEPPGESLLSGEAAASAASSFSQLSQHLLMPADGRTLEDVVRELLKPLLKSWLDANLPGIVQAKVDEEVERIARRRIGPVGTLPPATGGAR